MAINWTPDLSVGHEHIDSQHKMLFEKVNELFEAGKNRRSQEVIAGMLDFLDDYAKQHFKDEEAYMKEINYPDLDKQRDAHEKFVEEIAKLKKEYQESGGNILLIINANKFIVDWLTKHISNMDKKIGIYAKDQ